MFYISCDAVILQPLIVLLAAITRISGDVYGFTLGLFDVIDQMINECSGIRCRLMDGIGGDVLVVGTDQDFIHWFVPGWSLCFT